MARATTGAAVQAQVVDAAMRWVELRAPGSTTWEVAPALEPVESVVAVAPAISTARLLWRYGAMMDSPVEGFRLIPPVNIGGWAVRIVTRERSAGAGAVVQWVGVALGSGDDGAAVDASSPSGDQEI